MKTFLIILAVIVVLLIGFGIWFKSIYNQIDYNYKITKVRPENILKGQVGITLDLIVKNNSKYSVTLGKLYMELYYKNKLIAITPTLIGEVILKSNAETNIKDFNLNLFLNKESGAVIAKYTLKEPIDFEVTIKVNLFGIPIRVKRIPFTYSDYTNG